VKSLVSRLEWLEQIEARCARKPPIFVVGKLKRLPLGDAAEKYIKVLNRRPASRCSGSYDCEFEERPGPEPRQPETNANELHICLVGLREPGGTAPGRQMSIGAVERARLKIHVQDGGRYCRVAHIAERGRSRPHSRISVATLMRCQKEPEFQKAYRRCTSSAIRLARSAALQCLGGRGRDCKWPGVAICGPRWHHNLQEQSRAGEHGRFVAATINALKLISDDVPGGEHTAKSRARLGAHG